MIYSSKLHQIYRKFSFVLHRTNKRTRYLRFYTRDDFQLWRGYAVFVVYIIQDMKLKDRVEGWFRVFFPRRHKSVAALRSSRTHFRGTNENFQKHRLTQTI